MWPSSHDSCAETLAQAVSAGHLPAVTPVPILRRADESRPPPADHLLLRGHPTHLSLLSRARFLALLLAALVVAVPLAVAPPADAAVKKPLDIVKVYYDPPGRDYSKNSEYVKEYIQVKNTGKTTLTLTGYVIRDNGPQKYTFPKGFKIAPGKTVTIRSGTGKNTSTTLYWGKASFIWNNTGDTARLYSSKGTLLESCRYKGGAYKGSSTYARSDKTTAYC